MTLSSTEFTRGRLILEDSSEAWLLLDMLKAERYRLLAARAEMADEAFPDPVAYYNRRLAEVKRVRRRVVSLMAEKGWGSPGDDE